MEKQKICIIGGGLTGLITAITLSKLNLKIDLVIGSNNQITNSNRTVAISQNNYNFLEKLQISKLLKKDFWPCSQMKIYSEEKKEKFSKIFDLKNEKNEKKILYMIKNSKLMKHMIGNIKKNKLISIKSQNAYLDTINPGSLKNVKFNKKNNSKYNLVIICTGSNSTLVKQMFGNHSLGYSYKETSVSTIIDHKSFTNNIVRQIFFDDGILALLPISKTKSSIVWSVKKNKLNQYKEKKNLHFKSKIKCYTKNFLKNLKFKNNIEYKDLHLLIRKKYYHGRVILFGDALHTVHPFVGQGFNMVLRDLENLENILKNKNNLGLDVGSSDVLSEFSNKIKSSNFLYSVGIDFIKKFFSIKEKNLTNIRNKILVKLDKGNVVKKLFFNLANKGLNL